MKSGGGFMRSLYFSWLAGVALAQSQPGGIAGSITDPDDNSVAAVPIQLKRVDAGTRFDATSTAQGRLFVYRIGCGNL
jgi:hypothetical protein